MKMASLLCLMIGLALVLGSCADQNTTATTSAPHLPPEPGIAGTGGGGGGGGPNVMPKSIP
ncbi:MAG TPA: hypothetical protein VGM62_08690 [Chthoniobacterales bacterium]